MNLLELFEDTTTYFSRISYITLLIIYPLIQVLKFKYAEYGEDNNKYSEIEQDVSNFQHKEDEKIGLSNSNEEDNLKLDNLEQLISYRHHTQSKVTISTI
ncbi:6351_t:CDS:2 [Funneliformis mosseae]|uniref:6351_t:CDS:1 n=1 Tax=Funneliformis mosseae TaxID=27381 RepID=A0A9N8VQN8_FUNMO|nr:6351_t:CDS:2 [Funneliformis mosseae]